MDTFEERLHYYKCNDLKQYIILLYREGKTYGKYDMIFKALVDYYSTHTNIDPEINKIIDSMILEANNVIKKIE
jgi:hypothetical protein